MAEQLDNLDKQILNLLQKDARQPFAKIAEEVGVSEATIRYRVKNLEKNQIIKCYTTLLDLKKVGFPTTGILMLKIDPACFEQVAEQLGDLGEGYHVFQTTGDFDIVSVVHISDLARLGELKRTVQMIPGVREVSVSAAIQIIKIKTSCEL
jgi:Lrp/AsnC family transcriptional regulator for asnA, asnC and gidA